MLSIYISFGTTLMAVLAAFSLTPNKLVRHQIGPKILALIFLGCLVVGLTLTVINGNAVEYHYTMKNWPTVEGTITSVELVGPKNNRPELQYTYVVDRNFYEGVSNLRLPNFGASSTIYDVAVKSIADLRVGNKIKIYYDLEHPSTSEIRPGPLWDQFTRLSLGAVLYGVGLTGVLSIAFNRARAGKL